MILSPHLTSYFAKNLFIIAAIGNSIGHIPILPAQKSIINTILTIIGISGVIYDNDSPVFPIDAATTEYAVWKLLLKNSTTIRLIRNSNRYKNM